MLWRRAGFVLRRRVLRRARFCWRRGRDTPTDRRMPRISAVFRSLSGLSVSRGVYPKQTLSGGWRASSFSSIGISSRRVLQGKFDSRVDNRTARYTPAEISTMPNQSVLLGHSPTSGTANKADSAGTNAPNAEPPEAPRITTARPYRTRETMLTTTP
jgi:hypothetical protein